MRLPFAKVGEKRLRVIFPMTLIMGSLGLLAGSIISVTFFISLARAQQWDAPILSPFDEPLLNIVMGWMVAPWGIGLEAGWFFFGDGIVPFLGGAIAMGLFYTALGLVIDLIIKATGLIYSLGLLIREHISQR